MKSIYNSAPRTILRVTVLLNDVAAVEAYLPTLNALAARGHHLHLAILDPSMADPRRRLSRFRSAHAASSLGHAVSRSDGWRATGEALRTAIAALANPGDPAATPNPVLKTMIGLGLLAPDRAGSRSFALALLRRLHAALPPAAQVVRALDQLDADVVVLTNLEHQAGAQADYLLACRELAVGAAFVDAQDSKTGRSIAAAFEPDALLTPPAALPPVTAIEAAAAAPWPRRARRWAWLAPMMAMLRARIEHSRRLEAGGAHTAGRHFYADLVLPKLLSSSLKWIPPGRSLLRERLAEDLTAAEIARLADVEATIEQARAAPGPMIFAPWIGGPDQELLFWIPFLTWLRKTHQLDKSRTIALGLGGKNLWYAGAGAHYIDLAEVYGADRTPRLREKLIAAGPSGGTLAHECARRAAVKAGFDEFSLVRPEVMRQLYQAFLSGRAGPAFMERHARFHRIPIKPGKVERAVAGLPEDYVAVQFRACPSFPDTEENRALAVRAVRALSRNVEVLMFPAPTWADWRATDLLEGLQGPRIRRVEARLDEDLSAQSLLVAGSRGFVGAGGAIAYLAAQLGLSSICLQAVADPAQSLQLDWARRALSPFGGRLCALPIQVADEVGWLSDGLTPRQAAAERGELASVH